MNNRFRGASKKSILKTTPTSSPLHRGRDEREKALRYYSVSYPSCKGELEGVVKALALCGWNLKSKIIKSKI